MRFLILYFILLVCIGNSYAKDNANSNNQNILIKTNKKKVGTSKIKPVSKLKIKNYRENKRNSKIVSIKRSNKIRRK